MRATIQIYLDNEVPVQRRLPIPLAWEPPNECPALLKKLISVGQEGEDCLITQVDLGEG